MTLVQQVWCEEGHRIITSAFKWPCFTAHHESQHEMNMHASLMHVKPAALQYEVADTKCQALKDGAYCITNLRTHIPNPSDTDTR
jgi:hypothetical protein